MRAGGRVQAAIEVLEEVFGRHQPAASALANWGRNHRFAGAGDRAAIGNLVYDALRHKASSAAAMGADTPRALALYAAKTALLLSAAEVAKLADGVDHAPAPLTPEEATGLDREVASDAPAHVRGDYPDWLQPQFERVFGNRAGAEGAALARRAPIDLRVNPLKATREKVINALTRYHPEATQLSPLGIRIPAPVGPAKSPHVEAEAAHGRGWFEVQDEASQIAALLAGAGPRKQIADICAGAGGKTLALAGQMQNTGQIYAFDSDKLRLRPIFERLKRAGIRNVQVLDAGDDAALAALGPRFDVVMVDSPCTGTGTWRRRPESKWKLKPESITLRQAEQQKVLALGAGLVRPGGRLVYVTCSVLAEENTDQIAQFLAADPGFRTVPYANVWAEAVGGTAPVSADGRSDSLLLTPASHATDGFFIALLERA